MPSLAGCRTLSLLRRRSAKRQHVHTPANTPRARTHTHTHTRTRTHTHTHTHEFRVRNCIFDEHKVIWSMYSPRFHLLQDRRQRSKQRRISPTPPLTRRCNNQQAKTYHKNTDNTAEQSNAFDVQPVLLKGTPNESPYLWSCRWNGIRKIHPAAAFQSICGLFCIKQEFRNHENTALGAAILNRSVTDNMKASGVSSCRVHCVTSQAFFCSPLGKSEPTWLHHEELKQEANKKTNNYNPPFPTNNTTLISIDRTIIRSQWMELFAHFLRVLANLMCQRSGPPRCSPL